MERISSHITWKLEAMAETGDLELISSKRKAICALLQYAMFLEDAGQVEMIGAVSRVFRTSEHFGIAPHFTESYITTPSSILDSPSLNRYTTLVSHHLLWDEISLGEEAVITWVEAVSAVPYTEEVCQSVVDALLQIASVDSLRQHIPVEIWTWLNERPPLPPKCRGRSMGTAGDVVRHVRGLGDIEIFKSYLLLVWSEWDIPHASGLDEIRTSIREDFGGVEAWHHREDLMGRLDQVLGELDRGWEHHHRCNPRVSEDDIQAGKKKYGELKEALLESHREAMKGLTRTNIKFTICGNRANSRCCTGSQSNFACALPLPSV
jgi:hypothetical protein